MGKRLKNITSDFSEEDDLFMIFWWIFWGIVAVTAYLFRQ